MKLQAFYEVTDYRNEVEYGSASPSEAISWWRRGIGKTVYVSIWDEEDGEDFRLVTDRVDITAAIVAAIASEREMARAYG